MTATTATTTTVSRLEEARAVCLRQALGIDGCAYLVRAMVMVRNRRPLPTDFRQARDLHRLAHIAATGEPPARPLQPLAHYAVVIVFRDGHRLPRVLQTSLTRAHAEEFAQAERDRRGPDFGGAVLVEPGPDYGFLPEDYPAGYEPEGE